MRIRRAVTVVNGSAHNHYVNETAMLRMVSPGRDSTRASRLRSEHEDATVVNRIQNYHHQGC
jgi:hypothetical protein